MAKSRAELGWHNDSIRQDLYVSITRWCYKVFVRSSTVHETMFEFGGAVMRDTEPEGLKVSGEIMISREQLDALDGEPPRENRGMVQLLGLGRPIGPYLSVTLPVNSQVWDELFRTFSATFASNGPLYLNLDLEHPKGADHDFWCTGWHSEDVQVSKFDFISGGWSRRRKWLAKFL